jgi:hypothetical protein
VRRSREGQRGWIPAMETGHQRPHRRPRLRDVVRRSGGGERDLDYLFMLTYGRSGSTLLLGILNSLPGFLIRGENRDALHHLFLYHQTCLEERDRNRIADDSTNPFFGIDGYPADTAIDDLRRLALDTLLRPEPDTRVTGFKEIRWYQPDLPEYVAFLRQVFPGAKFVVNTRNHDDVAKSKWWAGNEKAPETLARREKRLLDLADDLGDSAYRVHYDDYVADPSTLTGLLTWLGVEYDAERVAGVLARRHSF